MRGGARKHTRATKSDAFPDFKSKIPNQWRISKDCDSEFTSRCAFISQCGEQGRPAVLGTLLACIAS
eukprot:7847905-Pyramimonas_sp.AAC.1